MLISLRAKMNFPETNYRKIGIVAAIAIAIAAMMIPAASLAVADKGGSVSGSGNVQQSISQSNSVSSSNSGSGGHASADFNSQSNDAANVASVHIHNDGSHDKGKSGHHDKGGGVKDSGNVVQSIDQSNSITATNSGSGGHASADFNSQSNDAANVASVHIHKHGSHDKVKDSGNVLQAIGQSNSITATNSGSGGSASADFNSQSNRAANLAFVDIHNHGGTIKDSGNVAQLIAQDNSITATNSPASIAWLDDMVPLSSASADFNSQTNSAANLAFVDIHNHGGTIKDSGNVAQLIAQANSINATNTGSFGSASADFNSQTNNAINFADVHIGNH
jgi:hypothetical protein